MTASVLTQARGRLAAMLDAALPDAEVTRNETVDRTDRPVVYVTDGSSTVEVESMRAGQRRSVYEWSLGLEVESRRWHATAQEAEDAVAAIMDRIDVFIADNPQLGQSGDRANGLPGLDWVRVASMEAPKSDHGVDEPLGGPSQWQAGGMVSLTLQTRRSP